MKNINDAIKIIATLGGKQEHQSNKPSGYQIIWNGLERLYSMVFTIELLKENGLLDVEKAIKFFSTMKY